MNFVGAGTKLQDEDISNLADELGIEEAALRAVLSVETGGKGFDVRSRPKALFERHIFYRQLVSRPDLQTQAVNAGLAYPKWGEKPYPPNSDGVYAEITAACDIDLEAALRATSWGLGQIMGNNCQMVGFGSALDMVQDAMISEANQLRQWAAFVKSAGLLDELKRKDWAGFAKGYNGPGYAKNQYDGSVYGTTSYVSQIATLAVVEETNPAFVTILPQMITYAENRIYRELDFLFTSIASTAYGLTAGNRVISVPAGTFVVPEQINLITPAGTTNPDDGNRVPLLATTKEFLDQVYGSGLSANRGQPKYFVPFDDYTFLVGPYPDSNYTCEIIGTYRPASLSSSNLTTFISLYLPDVFIMASMIYVSGYQRNFGRANDDPQMAVTYESQYQALKASALSEENRKKFEAAAWSSQGASTTASPTR